MTTESESINSQAELRPSACFQPTGWSQMGEHPRHKRHIASTLCGLAQDPPDWRPFPTELLPPGLAAYVRAEAEATVVDESMVGLPLLVAMAAAIGGSRQAGVKRGWNEPCMLWGALVAPASSGKTPAAQNVLNIVRERDHKVFRNSSPQRTRPQNEEAAPFSLSAVEDLGASFLTKLLTAPLPSDQLDSVLSGVQNLWPPESPQPTRYALQDATTEQLLSVLEANPRGVLMVRDELSGLFGTFGAGSRGSLDRSKYLSIWSAEHLADDRKITRSIYVRRPHASIYGGVQPDLLFRCLKADDVAAGLPARFLFAWPPERSRSWTEAEVPAELLGQLRRTFDHLYSLSLVYEPRDPAETSSEAQQDWRPVTLHLSAAARESFAEWFESVHRAQADVPDEALQAALGKLPGYAVRIALVLQLARWAERTALGEDPPQEIDSEILRSALGLAEWFANEAARVYQLQDRQRDDRDVRRLLHYVQRQGGSVTVRKVQTNLRAFRTTVAAERGLAQLVERGWACWTLGEKGRGVRVVGGVVEEEA